MAGKTDGMVMAERHPAGRTCNGMVADAARPVTIPAMLFTVLATVMSNMARHGNAGYGFTRQGSRGANSGGHRGGC